MGILVWKENASYGQKMTGIFSDSKRLGQQGRRYHKIRETFPKCFHSNVGLKCVLQQYISESIRHSDLVYEFFAI